MKDHNPAATMLVVGPFPRPGVEAEVEAVAAKVG
jgi:enamine deaminase RidA (YjgF/YER057c/UK114 family)